MTRSTWRWPVRASSVVACAAALACAGVVGVQALVGSGRPRYGGTLRIELPGAVQSLDPGSPCAEPAECAARDALLPAVFETLAGLDPEGVPQPLLAESWQGEALDTRWQLRLRPKVTLHDGTTLTPADVASVLRTANPSWTVAETADGVRIESASSMPDLPWQLCDPRLAIAVPRGSPVPAGTGPFRVERWEPGKRLVLAANAAHRNGRPFVDSVQVEMGRAPQEAVASLETGRADIVMLRPQDVRRAIDRHLRLATSRPMELVALAFDPRRPVASSEQVRTALALALDRDAICAILLQHQAEVASALVPDWLTGYASVFRARFDRGAARSIVASLPAAQRALSLTYPAGDPIALPVADRITVDAREAGLTLRTAASAASSMPPDVRLVHVSVQGLTPESAVTAVARALGMSGVSDTDEGSPIERSARFERAIIEPRIVVPLVHLSRTYALGVRLAHSNGHIVSANGSLDLADAWLGGDVQ